MQSDEQAIESGKPKVLLTAPYLPRVLIGRVTLDVWVNDELRPKQRLPAHALAHWNPEFVLGLGNELTWEQPWQGKISVARVRPPSRSENILSPAVVKVSGIRELAQRRLVLITWNPLDTLLNLVAFGSGPGTPPSPQLCSSPMMRW